MVYEMIERLKHLIELTIEARASQDDIVEYHVSLIPMNVPVMAECGHLEPSLDHVAVVHLTLRRGEDFPLTSSSSIIPEDDVHDDNAFIERIEKVWDGLVVTGFEATLGNDEF